MIKCRGTDIAFNNSSCRTIITKAAVTQPIKKGAHAIFTENTMAYRLRALLAVVLTSLISIPAHSTTVEPGTTFTAMWMLESDLTTTTVTDSAESVAGQDGTFNNVVVEGTNTTGLWDAQWQWMGNSDPFVTNNFTLTNLSGSTQTFTITSTIGIVPIGPASLTSGSIDGSITDNPTYGGATISTVSGNALYTALIDGSDYLTLLDDLYSVTVPGSSGGSADVGPASFTNQLGPAITSDIGIRIQFSLTAGDSVSFTSVFSVEETAVPVPAAVWLFGSGLIGLVGIARRKKA
jgi:hypothetical protein